MKDSPLFLLVPMLLIVGIMGFVFVGPKVPEETVVVGEQVSPKPEVDTATSSVVAVAYFNRGTSTTENFSDEERRVRTLELEKKRWLNRNLLLEKPCDFEEIKRFVDELLAKPEWAEVVKQYPNRVDTQHRETDLDNITASRVLHACFLEVKLQTNELSREEREAVPYEDIIKTWQTLPLINNGEDYHDGYATATLEDISFTFLPGDGPMGSSYGTYQYSNDKKSVRLFGVFDGFSSRLSLYETETTGKDPCPCGRGVTLRITNPISADDIRKALEEKKLPEDWEAGE